MFNRTKKFRYHIVILLASLSIFGFLRLPLGEQPLVQADSPRAIVDHAWEMAEASGAYEFRSQFEQTTYPAPSLANVGASSVTDRFALDGDINRPDETMTLTLFPNGSRSPENGISLYVDGDKAYGLRPGGGWEPLQENPGDLFAPGGDPLGYLAAAEEIRFVGTEADALDQEHRQYAFDFDGEAFANFARQQLEQQMQAEGKLPQGMELSTPDVYRNTVGEGQIWLDEAGLPSRMTVTLNLPPEANGEQATVVLQTDFYSFDHERIAIAQANPWTDGYTWLTSTLFLPENVAKIQAIGIQLSVAIILIVLAFMVITSSPKHRRQFLVAVNLSLVVMMLLSPLLHSHQVSAFAEGMLADQAAHAEQQAEQERVAEAEAELAEAEAWDPHQNPLTEAVAEEILTEEALLDTAVMPAFLPTQQQGEDDDLDETDTDLDGLIDTIEIWVGSDINDVDSDNDGLTDGTEFHTLGTDVIAVDSDGDSIPDQKEVEGFFYNNQQWYLNPLNGDTNGDGLPDSQECEPFSILSEDNSGICGDTDGDGEPDVFDLDNDNDGVPDKIDISPNQFVGDSDNFFDEDNPFAFSIDGLTPDEPVLVQFQLRPVDANQLYYSNSVLDWPTFDIEGQIQRTDHTTFADTPNQAIRLDAANANNGDMIVTPKLEIFVPHDSTYYANLPTLDTITDSVNIEGWLDVSALEPFGISVQQLNEDGDLNIYLPLNVQDDEESGAVVAFSAQTLYWPTATGWGDDHEVRLIWMVQTIVNDPGSSMDEVRAVHIYEDETWRLTGLDVREDHGFEMALIAEDPAIDADTDNDDDILNLATNLSLTFTEGADCTLGTDPEADCTVDGTRMTVAEIEERFDHASNDNATDGQRWYLPDSYVVDTVSYDHIGFIAHVAMTDTVDFLGSVFDGHTDLNPLLLFAREETSKGINLNLLDGTLDTASSLDLDISDQALVTTASLQAAAFRYVVDQVGPNSNTNWQSFTLDEYLPYLEGKLATQAEFRPDDPDDSAAVEAAQGKIMLAQIYLMTLHSGIVNVVEIDHEPWLAAEEYYNEQAFRPHAVTSWAGIATEMLIDGFYYLVWGIAPGTITDPDDITALGKFYRYINSAGNNIEQGPGDLRFLASGMPLSRIGRVTVGMALVAVLTITVWALVTNLTDAGGLANRETVGIILSGVSAAVTAVLLINLINKVVQVVRLASTQIILGYTTTFSVIRSVTTSARSGGLVGLIISVLITWGILLYYLFEGDLNKYGKRALIAYGVAATVVAIGLFLIALIPVVGIFIVLLITLFDAVTFIVCAAINSDKPICKGITGLITQAFAEAFYSVEGLVDLSDPDRVQYNIEGPILANPELGYTVDNSLIYSGTVTNIFGTYKLTDAFQIGPTDGERAEKASFSYVFQQSETDHHQELGWNEVIWDKLITRSEFFEGVEVATFGYLYKDFVLDPLTFDFSDYGAGLNVPLGDVYLSESYRVPIKECSLDIVCWANEKEDGTVHINIGSLLYFDIIPATLDDFMALTEKDGGYAQAWGQDANAVIGYPQGVTFPRLKDADNDGLRNLLDGGSDPDDSDWDSDDDGLSDFRELALGTNPESADTDNDTLTDLEEVRFGSNPLKADEDNDGLGDAVELEGWLIGYLGADGEIYQTRVWSDPNVADMDNDGLLDLVEFTYGLNPNRPDEKDVVNNALDFVNLSVDEIETPLLQLPFNETAGPTFNDISGEGHIASCTADHCPLAQVAGRYGTGAHFDGVSEYLTVNDIDIANQSFTVASWVKRDTTGTTDYIFSQGLSQANQGLSFGFNANDRFTCAFFDNAVVTDQPYTDSDWHHWACTYDAESNERTIYRDGVSVAQDTATADFQGNGTIFIGRRLFVSDYFGGSLDDVVLFDNALTAVEVENLRDGRYHANDLIVLPGANLTYEVTAENILLGRTASGHFIAEPPAEPTPLTVSDELQSFTLAPLASTTLSGTIEVAPSAADGVYPLRLTAEGAINADESALFLSAPDPDIGIYFETNQFGNHPNDEIAGSLGDDILSVCVPPVRYGTQDCGLFTEDGINGRGVAFNGEDQAILIRSASDSSALEIIEDDFTIGAWIYPTHDVNDTTGRAVLGYYDPDQLWFDFRGNQDNTFFDEAGEFEATCSGSACPTSDANGNVFDGIDDVLTIANTENINLQTVEHISILMDFSINPGLLAGEMVLYEQGGATSGLNIYADEHEDGSSQMHVCAWDLDGQISFGPSCVNFFASRGISHRLIVTFDGGDPLQGIPGLMVVYLDGQLMGFQSNVFDIQEHANGIGIGGVNGATRIISGTRSEGEAHFWGQIRTLAFFPTTLTANQAAFYSDNYFGEVFPTLFVAGENVGMAFEETADDNDIFVDTPSGYFGLQPNRWSHIAMSYDAFNQEAILYHNGVEVRSETIELALPMLTNPQFRLGWAGGPFGNFEGTIDSVIVYDDALSAEEIVNVASLIFNENIVLHHEFDEIPGSSQFQYGYETDEFATCSGASCPLSGLRGQINWAVDFDGSTYIDGQLPLSQDAVYDHFSLSTWVKTTNNGTIFEYVGGGDRLTVRTDTLIIEAGGNQAVSFSGVNDDEWHHLVLTFDSSDSARVYLDGVEVASEVIAVDAPTVVAQGDYRIGRRINGDFALDGRLDDLRFYDTALTPNQVVDLYERSAPALQLRLDEDELATEALDASPNGYVGEIIRAQPGVEGRLGNAVRFTHEGSNGSLIEFFDIAALSESTSNFTIMTWIKTDAYHGNGAGEGIFAWEHSLLRMNNGIDSKSYTLHGASGTPDLPHNLGQWEHLAISVDDSGNIRYYLNGVLIDTALFDAADFPDGHVTLGQEFFNPNAGIVDTSLDEFAFYNRALSALEIADLYRLDARWYRTVDTFRITVDTDAPTVALRSDATYWQNQSTVLDVMTSDPTSVVTLVDMGIKSPNDSDYTWQGAPACTDAEPGAAWCPTFDPSQLAGEGVYELVFRAVDAAGNETLSASYFLIVDGNGPETSLNTNSGFNGYDQISATEWTIPLSGLVDDPDIANGGGAGSGLVAESVRVTLYEEDGDVAGSGPQIAEVNGSQWSLDYLFNGRKPNGLYTVNIIAMDEVGNIAETTVGTVLIDGRASRIDLYAEAGEHENIPSGTQLPPVDESSSGFNIAPSEVLTAVHTLEGTVSDSPALAGTRLNLHLEEAVNSTVFLDSSGWQHTATCTNCPAVTAGLFGQARDFDGVDDVIRIGEAGSMNIGPALTLSAWVNPDVVPTDGIARFITLGSGKAVLRIDNGDLHFYMNLDGTNQHVRVSDLLTAGEYQHVAGTYDGLTLRVYHNGLLVGSLDATGAVDDSSGVTINSAGEPFDGQIDEIMIFERALLEHELYDLAQANVAGVAEVETSFELLGDGSYAANLPLPDNAQLYLPFNETRLDDVGELTVAFADYSGVGHTVTCADTVTCPEAEAAGQEGDALFFDGQDDFLTATTAIDPGVDEFTAAAWFNVDEIKANDQVILSQLNGSGTGQTWLGILDSGEAYTFLNGSSLNGSTSITTNAWHHVAVINDGSTLSLYLDGQLEASVAYAGPSSDGELLIGASNNGTNQFGGRLDEITLFDRALCPSRNCDR